MMHFCIYGVVFLHTFCDKSRSAAPHSRKQQIPFIFSSSDKKRRTAPAVRRICLTLKKFFFSKKFFFFQRNILFKDDFFPFLRLYKRKKFSVAYFFHEISLFRFL